MPSDSEIPTSKPTGSGPTGVSHDAISVSIARDVLRRVREGHLPIQEQQTDSRQPNHASQ